MEIISIIVPIFVMLAVGYILRKIGLIGNETKNFLSKIIYYFAFPAMTFRSIVSFDFASTFKLKLVAHNISVTFTVFVITFLLAFLIRDPRKRGSFNMGCFRSNQGYMGLPVVNGFYGEEAMSRAAVVNGFDSPAVIVFSVFALEIFRKDKNGKTDGSQGGKQAGFRHGIKIGIQKFAGFITNPFVISAALGLVLSYYRVPVLKAAVLDELLKTAGNMALPLALISIGCSIEVRHLKANMKLVIGASFFKLLLAPGIAFVLANFFFKFSGTDLGLSVILTAMPSSVSSYVMACEMGTDEEVMASIIGFTTFASVITISLVQVFMGMVI